MNTRQFSARRLFARFRTAAKPHRMPVLASDVAPVREIIEHERTGLLADFFDLDDLTAQALRVLDDPVAFRSLGRAGAELIDKNYSLAKTLPQMDAFYRRIAAQFTG
jgi:glycosyltransferase involved in cell wall biosynthesis